MKYRTIFTPTAIKDLAGIYYYIMDEFGDIDTADRLLSSLHEAVNTLKNFPYRCALRKIGRYANSSHRQLFVKNFTVVYRVDELRQRVFVVAVRYTPSDF